MRGAGVASGITAHAEAEWSSLLPLEDGTYQMVRGLTMKNITADMPEFDLNPALNTFKRECPDNKRIQNLKFHEYCLNLILILALCQSVASQGGGDGSKKPA